jgi:phytoene dehydrogenase-like protein
MRARAGRPAADLCGGALPRLGAGGVEAVELAGGEALACRAVLSTLTPRTLLELVPPGTLGASTENAARSFRSRGATAVLRLALAGTPRFAGRENDPVEHAVSAPDLLALERAADSLKYRKLPAEVWVEVRLPSRADPSLAPQGKCVAIVQCHTVSHDLSGEGGWNDATRARLAQAMLAAFERLAPGALATVLGQELLTPPDIEARYGTPGGHIFDGELALDQLCCSARAWDCAATRRRSRALPGRLGLAPGRTVPRRRGRAVARAPSPPDRREPAATTPLPACSSAQSLSKNRKGRARIAREANPRGREQCQGHCCSA